MFSHDLDDVSLAEALIKVSEHLRSEFCSKTVFKQLDALYLEAKQTLQMESDGERRLEKFLALFYGRWGFSEPNGSFLLSDMFWLDKVLESRKGTAVSLGAILLYLANQLELTIAPVIFPSQLLLRSDTEAGEMWFINPFNGKTLDESMLHAWLRGTVGIEAELYDDDLSISSTSEVFYRVLHTLKSSLMDEQQMEKALQVSQLLLEFEPDDPYVIRDRGLIYAQLECGQAAFNDLSYFIKHCPDDPISEMIKVQMCSLEQTSVVLH